MYEKGRGAFALRLFCSGSLRRNMGGFPSPSPLCFDMRSRPLLS